MLRGESARKMTGRNSYHKLLWKGDDSGSEGAEVLVAKK